MNVPKLALIGLLACACADESAPMHFVSNPDTRDSGADAPRDEGTVDATLLLDAGIGDAAVDAAPECPDGRTWCDGFCADLETDEFNCGGCGRRCYAENSCCNGWCGHSHCWFDGHTCKGGVVTTWFVGVFGCDLKVCPHYTSYVCARGCRTDVTEVEGSRGAHPATMCEEGRPKKDGDPCLNDDHCRPTPAARIGASCEVENTYLACDVPAKVCVDRPPPVIDDYMAPCGIQFGDISPGAYGYVETDACLAGLCLVVSDSSEECVMQACTAPCRRDEDCPPGSTCARLPNQTPGGGSSETVCKPGTPRSVGCNMSCP